MRALFARLTKAEKRGAALFEALVAEARRPHWFVEGGVPDSVEGRFAVLTTVLALAVVRLERESSSAALTERFIEAMDAEVRQMGVGDPTVGKQVRGLVGALASRVERWRTTVADEGQWRATTQRSLYRDQPVEEAALAHGEAETRRLWQRLEALAAEALAEGRIG